MSTCPHTDQVIAYALHQLTAEEAAALKAHLAACLACRLKLTEVTETMDHLALAAPPGPPPPGLKQKVMERVAKEALAPAAAKAPRRWLVPSWAAAALVAIALGGYALLRVEGLQQRLLGFQQATPVQVSVALKGVSSEMAGASGRVVFVREGGGTRITLEGQGLQPLPPGQVYQLWLIKDGKRTSGGVFVVDATGRGGTTTWLPGDAPFDALGVTREPDAFGNQPRGPRVMASST